MKTTLGDRVFGLVNGLILALLAFLCFYPMYYVLVASLSEPAQLTARTGLLVLPLGFSLQGYKLVSLHPFLYNSYLNTVLYVVSGTLLNLIVTALAAYALSRRNVKYSKYLIKIIVVTMFFSGGLIPNYILIRDLGLLYSPLALIIPGCLNTWSLIILRTAFMQIPDSLEESAKIDGAGNMVILFRILLPLCLATMAVLALLYAVGMWNSWFTPMIYLKDRKYFPLSLVLREILVNNSVDEMVKQFYDASSSAQNAYRKLVKYAVIIVATLPILCLYPFLQRYFVKGVMLGSLKQ